MAINLYSDSSAITPLFPEDGGNLNELSIELIKQAAALSGSLHPLTREAIAKLIEPMNSYYSNLIEGHNTHPLDIEKALNKDYSDEPKMKLLQLESFAHVSTQKNMKARLNDEKTKICSPEFIKWLHSDFYNDMPPEFHFSEGTNGAKIKIAPGGFRTSEPASPS